MGATQLLERWRYFEQQASYAVPVGIDAQHADYAYEAFGKERLLFCAPHAVATYHTGKRKAAEPATGALAFALAERFGGAALVSVGAPTDLVPLRRKMLELAQAGYFLVDLHGMRDAHGMDVCVGLSTTPSRRSQQLAVELEAAVKAQGLNFALNTPFGALSPRCNVNLLQAFGYEGVQIELAASVRKIREEGTPAEKLGVALVKALAVDGK